MTATLNVSRVDTRPAGLPAGYTAPSYVPELLAAAAALVERNGLYRGLYWTEIKFDLAMYHQPVRGHGALYLAAGFNPYLLNQRRTYCAAPQIVTDTEELLAEYLMMRGELPQYDRDWYVDTEAVIRTYEDDRSMTASELAEMWRDCSTWVCAGGAR